MRKLKYSILFVLFFNLTSLKAVQNGITEGCNDEGACVFRDVSHGYRHRLEQPLGNLLAYRYQIDGRVWFTDPEGKPLRNPYHKNIGFMTAEIKVNSQKKCKDNSIHSLNKNWNFLNVAIMSNDERRYINSNDPEFLNNQVGIVTTDNSWFTSFVTGENCDVLVTSAHLIYDFEKKQKKVIGDRLDFIPDPNQPAENNSWGSVVSSSVANGHLSKRTIETNKHDWLVARLDKPLVKGCLKNIKPSLNYKCKGRLIIVGYHSDRMSSISISEGSNNNYCYQKEYDKNKGWFKHDCDTITKSSGSPVFCKEENKDLIWIGVNDSEFTPYGYIKPKNGKPGLEYSNYNYNNRGVAFHQEFYDSLIDELSKSKKRKSKSD